MMAYHSGFAVSVLKDGKPIREFDEDGLRVCRIPFGTEYQIRIKNKNQHKAMATVSIDGTEVFMHDRRLILQPGGTIDLERFVENLNEGKRFKFVEASNPGVQDPTSKENGLIKVSIWPEVIVDHFITTTGCFNSSDGDSHILRRHSAGGGQHVNSSRKRYSGSSTQEFYASSSTGATHMDCYVASAGIPADTGATVEGAHSDQKFESGAWFPTVSFPTTIDIWLKGQSDRMDELMIVTLCKDGKMGLSYMGNYVATTSIRIDDGVLTARAPGMEITTVNYRLITEK